MTMDYEKAYKKALERAATELETCGADESLRNMIYAIFPDELKESEDEKTRKELINFLKSPFMKENIADWKVAPWLSWLEKQGKKKSIDDLTAQEAMDIAVDKCFEGGKKDPCEECSCAMLNCTHFPCDKKKEFDGEKVAMATMDMEGEGKKYCKDKPKFKVGDFILNGDVTDYGRKEIFKIRNVCSDWYDVENIYDGRKTIITFKQEWSCRLWDITDAKNGDVLYSLDSKQPFLYKERPQFSQARGYCCINKFGEFAVWNTSKCIICTDKYVPATKEQQELLFQKMKEAGYEWDAEKKEFKQLSQPKVTKTSEQVWSEGDELNIKEITKAIYFKYKDTVQSAGLECWLKSLKDRLGGK